MAVDASSFAGTAFGDVTQFVFVPSAEQPTATVVDVGSNRIVGSVGLGAVPQQVLISRTEAHLIVTDGRSSEIVTVDLATLGLTRVPLSHAAERLVLGTNGWLLAAADLRSGTITLFDLRRGIVMGRVDGLPPLRDFMFVDQDGYLFVAAQGWTSIAVVDTNTARVMRWISPDGNTGIVAFARTPNGRSVLAQPASADPPSIIDVESNKIVGTLGQAVVKDGITPSGTGAFLFIPENRDATFCVYREGRFSSPAILPAKPGMNAVYSAWLDSVAFVSCVPSRELLVYDLDTLRPAGSLPLGGQPGQGGVTPDSAKLYVPLASPSGLGIVDCQNRRVAATLPMASRPLAAVVPGGWGICH
jgi:DNA-binding beta-propeller fold protein YncE